MKNMAIVKNIEKNDFNNSYIFPPAIDLSKIHTFPTGACPEPKARVPAAVRGDRALMKIASDTPAAMNKDIPEPNPYLDITSSMNKISIPPKNNWSTRINCMEKNCDGINVAVGANPPMNT